MDSVQEMHSELAVKAQAAESVGVQPAGYLLELSFDWIILRASENIHRLLGKSHVILIDEQLGRFVHSEALHDLRNLFSRLSGTTGVGRAYRVRLTNEPELSDIAFQQVDGRILLEIVPAAERFGEWLGSVGGLIDGLADSHGQALIDGGARRMRALTGFDRVTLLVGDLRSTNSRAGVPFSAGANASLSEDFPAIVPDSTAATVPVFPRDDQDSSAPAALLRALSTEQKAELEGRGFASAMRVPVMLDGEKAGEFRLAHTKPRRPRLEVHAAAELFAQLFAMRLEIDRLKGG